MQSCVIMRSFHVLCKININIKGNVILCPLSQISFSISSLVTCITNTCRNEPLLDPVERYHIPSSVHSTRSLTYYHDDAPLKLLFICIKLFADIVYRCIYAGHQSTLHKTGSHHSELFAGTYRCSTNDENPKLGNSCFFKGRR